MVASCLVLITQVSEAFLQRLMALYTAAHYKNQVGGDDTGLIKSFVFVD